jgi:hypothetical protein
MLLVLLRAVVAAREGKDQRIVALQLAQAADGAGVVGQLVVGKGGSGNDVGTHDVPPSSSRCNKDWNAAGVVAPVETPGPQGLSRARRVARRATLSAPSRKGSGHAVRHGRAGEHRRHPALLRGPRHRSADRSHPRLPAERAGLGAAGAGVARHRFPGHRLRSARLRQVQPAERRLRLQHVRG